MLENADTIVTHSMRSQAARFALQPDLVADNEPQIPSDADADAMVADVFADIALASSDADRWAHALLRIIHALMACSTHDREAVAIQFQRAIYARTRDVADRMDDFIKYSVTASTMATIASVM